MTAKKPPITLPSVDALFGIPNTGESVQEISIKQLHSFRDHPFRVEPDEKLIESVREYGVLSPLLARKKVEGEYEIISGHRRKAAAEQIGLDRLPVLVRDLTDEEATRTGELHLTSCARHRFATRRTVTICGTA